MLVEIRKNEEMTNIYLDQLKHYPGVLLFYGSLLFQYIQKYIQKY